MKKTEDKNEIKINFTILKLSLLITIENLDMITNIVFK